MRFAFHARGHPNITASHPTTFEFTRDPNVSRRGDCIIAVAAECGLAGLPAQMARAMRSPDACMRVRIRCGDAEDTIVGRGDPGLTYSHLSEMVGRRSGYACGRTLCVRADKAARDLDRELAEAMRGCGDVEIVLKVVVAGDQSGSVK